MWGECSTRFEPDNIQAIGQKEPIITIFVGTLSKTFKGQTTLSGSTGCRWYINEDIPENNRLRSSVQAKFVPLKPIASSTQDILGSSKQIAIEDKTVEELLELDLFDCEGMQFACTVTVTRLSPGQRWWFPSCLLCHKTSIPTGSVYRCSDPNCSSTNAEPKYHISLLASDGTAEAEFVLFGRIGQQIIQKPILALPCTDRPIHEPIHEMVVAARAA